MAKRTKTESGADFTRIVTLRVKPEEYAVLQAEADKFGYTVSQAMRYIIFKKKRLPADPGKLSENEKEYRRQLAVKTIVTAVKNLAREFAANTSAFERSLMLLDADGNPVVNTESTLAMQSYLQGLLLDCQKEINVAVKELRGDEIHLIAKRPSLAKPVKAEPAETLSEEENKKANPNYYNMQKITICGNIAMEPKDVASKTNTPMTRFAVVCDEVVGEEKVSTRYTVVTKKTGIVDYLKSGRQVTVFGKLRAKIGKDSKGTPYLDLLLLADDIVLN